MQDCKFMSKIVYLCTVYIASQTKVVGSLINVTILLNHSLRQHKTPAFYIIAIQIRCRLVSSAILFILSGARFSDIV